MLMEADLPSDVEALRALLEQARELDALKVFQAEVERLKAIIEALQRHRFGRRSEQLDPDQFELALEEVETALAEAQHAVAKVSKASSDRPRKANRGSLPAHLERIEQVDGFGGYAAMARRRKQVSLALLLGTREAQVLRAGR